MSTAKKTGLEKTKITRSNENTFEWGLRPLILCSLLFGINLNTEKIKSKLIFCFGLAFGISHLIFNSIIFWKTFAKHVVYGKVQVHHPDRPENAPNIITSVTGVFVFTIPMIGAHLIFIFLQRRWKALWSLLIDIQSKMLLDHKFYQICRRHCWIHLFLLLIEQGAYIQASLGLSYYGKLPIFPQNVAIALGNLFHLVVLIIQTIFSVKVAVAAELFGVFHKRMVAISKRNYDNRRMSEELEKWRSHFELVCRLVVHINLCFRGVLIVIFIYAFGGVIKYTTHLFNLEHNSWNDYFFILFEIYCRLATILIGSHKLQTTDFEVKKSLRHLSLSNNTSLQIQISNVHMQLSQSEPSAISIMDITLNLTVIPTILGTILTYCIIVYEAGSA